MVIIGESLVYGRETPSNKKSGDMEFIECQLPYCERW